MHHLLDTDTSPCTCSWKRSRTLERPVQAMHIRSPKQKSKNRKKVSNQTVQAKHHENKHGKHHPKRQNATHRTTAPYETQEPMQCPRPYPPMTNGWLSRPAMEPSPPRAKQNGRRQSNNERTKKSGKQEGKRSTGVIGKEENRCCHRAKEKPTNSPRTAGTRTEKWTTHQRHKSTLQRA